MKQLSLLFALILCFISSTSVQETDRTNTKVNQLQWTGKAAFNAYSLSGTIDIKRVSTQLASNTIEDLLIEIDMGSLHHENSDLKRHLRSEDFFKVDEFQTASFQLSEPVEIINGKAILKGELSIKGISKEETYEVEIIENVLILDITINRLNYGITFNSPTIFEKMKDQAIADEFKLTGQIPLK